jgi:hypothetical protein
MRLPISLVFVTAVTLGVRAAEPIDYGRDVKPILVRHCVSCHGSQKQRAGLRVDTAKGVIQGGNSGAALVAGKSAESRMIKAVLHSEGVAAMPPKGRLTADEVAVLRGWIDQGAKAPDNESVVVAGGNKSQHWSFQTPMRPPVPGVKNPAWARNPIDRFILARLDKEKLTPAPEADRAVLIRRVSLDLLGLPPSVAEVNEFVADQRPDAYERLVDRLLANPHFGERWGRHWLDQARYADSNGFTIDGPRDIWKYRDWVIAALNRNEPFDQFTIDQLAGDLLPQATVDQKIATGFHRNTPRNEEGGIDLEQFRVESVVDRVNTTGSVWLGLTVGCCQCHDHKFDPIAQREFYQLFAFLNNADEPLLELGNPAEIVARNKIRSALAVIDKRRRTVDFTSEEKERKWEEHLTPSLKKLFPSDVQAALALPENGRNPVQKRIVTTAYRRIDMLPHAAAGFAALTPLPTAAHFATLAYRETTERTIREMKDREPVIMTTLVMQERSTPRVTNVHIQGDFTRKGVVVTPGVPAVLHPLTPSNKPTRLDLAHWLVDPKNPLTARVTVNRYWQVFFGVGLVETENDFGTQGTPPSHPELLDWLATEFIRGGWSVKSMHRLIVTSATYRQSSHTRPELATIDARNRLLARQNRLRLEAEVVRDAALAASGLLTRKIGGPSVYPPQPEGVYAFTQINKNWKAETGPGRYRRGVYTYFWRSAPHPGLTVFDAPDANGACTRRNRSNTPLQALTLLNDQAYVEIARGLADRVLTEVPTESGRVAHAFQLCVGRLPTPFEQTRISDLLAQQRTAFAAAPQEAKQLGGDQARSTVPAELVAAWTATARVLLNLDECITRE